MMCRFDGPKELTTMLGLAAGEPILAVELTGDRRAAPLRTRKN